jgi:adenine-specific DNA-methyltransferase
MEFQFYNDYIQYNTIHIMTDDYLTKQIITYMGNKRKLLKHIKEIVINLEEKNGRKLKIGDGFSGSGIVSRLFKQHSSELYTNDLAGYAKTLNHCFLTQLNDNESSQLEKYIDIANKHADNKPKKYLKSYISGNWSPKDQTKITQNDRVYFTYENGIRIDIIRNYINTIPKKYQPFLLGSLLVESSIHNNTNGQFSAYYKNEDGIGQYGGKKNIDLKRITSPITLKMPVSYTSNSKIHISNMDTNEWVKQIPELDLVYYDPPYNKHPYSTFYFLLDIINNWNNEDEIPSTYRGQQKNWIKSKYNSSVDAEKTFSELISNTPSKYILISYNSGGIIPIERMDSILKQYTNVTKIPVTHNTYNRLKGISEYKSKKPTTKVNEFFWLVEK